MKTQAPILQTAGLTAKFSDRLLFADLNLCLEHGDKVALIGRNGVGKSTLLSLLAGDSHSQRGEVTRRGQLFLVPQRLAGEGQSPGEQRREYLQQAQSSGADLLLLDEPTQDLDDATVGWLRSWLFAWDRALIVATHDRRLLGDFQDFFLMAESGCRHFSGAFPSLEAELEREFRAQENRYLRRLNHLSKEEEQSLQFARRRRRKKQCGRVREIDRATSRACLNLKRGQAQVNHGRINGRREERLEEVRDWTRSARRALKVDLALELDMPELSTDPLSPVIRAQGICALRNGRCLFRDLTLFMGRERVAVTGPNGAGKTTLLQTLAGKLKPDSGTVQVDGPRLGVIEQGGANWMFDSSLVEYLERFVASEAVGRNLVAQKFPLALAQRPLRTLSPGERVRAALIGLLAQQPPVELLVLDEPTYSLDLIGQKASRQLLQAWPGGLLIASHDEEFLQSLGVEKTVRLSGV
jgi:ATPase subunit of ABC transporter with duplicated ATPase domains